MFVSGAPCITGAVDGFILDVDGRKTQDPREFCCVIPQTNNTFLLLQYSFLLAEALEIGYKYISQDVKEKRCSENG